MNSLQILHCLRGIENHTTGVYPADRIPKVLTKPIAIVVNTDGHKLPGAHWVAMYVDRSGHGWFFDSYGLPPIVPDHLTRLRRNCRLFEYNATQLQGPSSQCCGHYCVMFLHYMCTGLGLRKFKSVFSSNLELNDKIVYDYYRAYINNNKKKFIIPGNNNTGATVGGNYNKKKCIFRNRYLHRIQSCCSRDHCL